jgi:hypothetical protein
MLDADELGEGFDELGLLTGGECSAGASVAPLRLRSLCCESTASETEVGTARVPGTIRTVRPALEAGAAGQAE